MSSGWFDHTEPQRTTVMYGEESLQGSFELTRNCPVGLLPPAAKWFEDVQCGRTTPNSRRLCTPKLPCPAANWFEEVRCGPTTPNSCMHAGPHHCVRTWEGPTGAGWRRMVCVRQDKHYKPRTRPPRWLGRGLHDYAQCLSDLGGGVNGHDVNLHDKCGVCDDVTG